MANMKVNSRSDHVWRFVTNHAHVLECIYADPTARLRDIADRVGITERTAAQIVKDLEEAGYLTKTRDGRRNRYEVHGELPLRHPRHRHRTVGDLIRFLEATGEAGEPALTVQPKRLSTSPSRGSRSRRRESSR
jgi:DNA-binding transcriptional ArsR family regulator